MTMKYGQIAVSNSINVMIYHCFEYICEEDQRKFVKKFKEQPHDSDQIMHSLRELVLGAYLGSKGFNVRYDYVIDNQTPDWSILDTEGESITAIVELTNFHIDKATEDEIEEQARVSNIASYRRDGNKNNVNRLYQALWKKAWTYKSLIEKLHISYVVVVFGELEAILEFDEFCSCLIDKMTGIFGMYPELSGGLYFVQNHEQYSFNYISNPNALQIMELPIGVFPYRAS